MPAENGADDVVGCDKRDTEKTDGQVADGTADSFLRGGHDSHNGFYKTEQDCGQSNGQQHEQRCRVADGQVHLPAVCAPTARPVITVVPIASPTIMTVSMCMT